MFKNPRYKKMLHLIALLPVIFILNGCGVTKNFNIDSTPPGALVVIQRHEGEFALDEEQLGETPLKKSVNFFDNTTVSMTAEKRGYSFEKVVTNKDSSEAVRFTLQKVDGMPETKAFRQETLESARFILLPAFVEVAIHSGVGRLDKKEFSPEASRKVSDDLNTTLSKAVGTGTAKIQMAKIDAPGMAQWQALTGNLNQYLLKLQPGRLPYYSLPPYIAANVVGIKPLLEQIPGQNQDENTYLLYVYGKCISETSGRKVGNIMLGIMGGATQGYAAASHTAFYYDPDAFNPDSGTMALIYVIDAKTSEVVHIEQRLFSDITDGDALSQMADSVSAFPELDKRKQQYSQ